MKTSAVRFLTVILFALLSLPWAHGASLTLAQDQQPTPQPSIAETMKMIGSQSTDWCKSITITASFVNGVVTYADLKAEQVKIWLGIYRNSKDGRDAIAALALRYRNTQRVLAIAYTVCAMMPKFASFLPPPSP